MFLTIHKAEAPEIALQGLGISREYGEMLRERIEAFQCAAIAYADTRIPCQRPLP